MGNKMNDKIAKALAGRKAEKEAKKNQKKDPLVAEVKQFKKDHPKEYAKAEKKNKALEQKFLKQEAQSQKKPTTVKDLMAEAQARGIKYFRILSKKELRAVLDMHQHALDNGITEPWNIASIQKIQDGAKARWKAGWGKEKKA